MYKRDLNCGQNFFYWSSMNFNLQVGVHIPLCLQIATSRWQLVLVCKKWKSASRFPNWRSVLLNCILKKPNHRSVVMGSGSDNLNQSPMNPNFQNQWTNFLTLFLTVVMMTISMSSILQPYDTSLQNCRLY